MTEIPVEERIKAGGFLPLQLTLDPLQKILLDLITMIKDHDIKIENLENTKADKMDITLLQTNIDGNKKDVDKRFDELEKLINDKNSNLLNQINQIKDKADAAFNGLRDANDKLATFQGNIDKLNNQVNDLQELVDGQRSQITSMKNDLGDMKSKVDMMNGKVLTMDGAINNLGNVLGSLRNQISNMGQGSSNDADIKDRDFNAQNISNPELEKSVNELANKLNGLEDAIKSLQLQRGSSVPSSSNVNIDLSKYATNDGLNKLEKKVDGNYNDLKSQIDALKKKFDSMKSNDSSDQSNWRPRRDLTPVERVSKTDTDEFPVRPPSAGNSASKQEFEDLAERVRKLEDKTEDHDKELTKHDNLLNDHNTQLKSHQNSIDDHEKRISDLEKRVAELKSMADKISEMQDLSDELRRLQTEIEQRPTKDLIERLFEKFKQSMNQVVDMIKKQKGDGLESNFATKEDLKKVESMLKSFSVEFEEAAAARKCTKCLSCGRGYREVAGALPDQESAQILGAAPISAVMDGVNKPCFVYGTDKELYYSSNPRGKSFVVRGQTPPKSSRT